MTKHKNDVEIFLERSPLYLGGHVKMYVLIKDGDKRFHAKNIEFEEMTPGLCTDSLLEIYPPMAQKMMDQLWDCGYRPTEGSGSAGSLAATERHLSDMQKIVFHKLGIGKKTE